MFKKLFEHNITSHDGQFFCYLCMIVRSDLEDVLYHITEEKHLLLQSEQTTNVLKDYAEQTCRTLVANNIGIITLSSFYCTVCQCNFTDLISTLLHVRSRYHINQLKKYYVDINYDKDKSKTCIISLMSELLRVKKKKLASFDKSLLIKDMYQDCNLNAFKGYHELQFFRTFHNYSNEDCKILVNNGILKINYYELMCQYCYRCCPTVDDILQHVKATKHIFDLTENDIILNKEECKQDEHISVNSELMKTIMNLNVSKMKQTGESRIIDLLKYISIKTQQEQDTNVNEKLLCNDLICKLCTCHLPSFDHILHHVIGKQHVNLLMYINNKLIYSTKQNNNENEKLDLLQENIDTFSEKLEINYDHIFLSNKIIIEESNFQCILCPRKIDTLHNTLQHIEGKCHTNKLKYFDNSSNTSKIDYALCTNSNNDESAFQEVNTDIFSEKLEVKDCQSNFKSNIDYKISSSSHMNYLKNYDHTLLTNKIIIEESTFLCIPCTRKIDTLHNTLQHIEGKCHTNKLRDFDKSHNKISSSSHMNYLKNYDHIFQTNKIIIEESNFLCILCSRKIDTLHNTLQHIEGKCHTNKLKDFDNSSNTSKIDYALCTNYNNDESAFQEVNTDIFSEKLEVKDCQSNFKSNIDYKISSSIHMNYLKNYDHIFFSNKIIIEESNFLCIPCIRKIDTLHNTLQHIEGKCHTNKLRDFDKSHNKISSSSHMNYLENYDHIFLNNKITIQESNFLCILCTRKIDTLHNTLQHIEGKCHTNKLKDFDNSSNTSKMDYALCINSNNDGSAFQEVNTDIFSEKLEVKDCQSNFKSNIDYKISSSIHMNYLKNYDHIFFSNKIIIEESNFLCIPCIRKIDTLHNTLQHIEGKCHTNKLIYFDKSHNNISLSSHMNYLENYDHIFLSNKITIQESNFLCILCTRKIDTLHNTLQHIEGKCHTNKLKDFDNSSNTSKIDYALCTNFNNNEIAIQNLTTNFISSEMKEKVVTAIEIEDNDSNAIIFNECLYYCELCGIQINIKNANKHINALIHKNKIPAISTEYDMFIYKCFCCKSIIQGTSLLINHLNSAKHLNNSTKTLRHIKAINIEIFTQLPDNIQNMLKDTKSSLCNFIFPEFGNIPMNSFKKEFILFDVSNIVIYNNIKNKIVFFCSICSTTSDTPHKLSSSCKSFPTITDNYSIIPNYINTEMMTLICASPLKTNRMKKHIYKEERPVKHLNKIYCEKYLQIEEIMYILDKRKLDNIKLNFELFMPYNAKQLYCLACNINVSKDLDLLYEHACLKPHKMKVNDIENDKNHGELLKQYMQKISSDFVKCHICRSCIRNDTDSIDAHINDTMHKKRYNNFRIFINNTFNSVKQILSNLWYSIEKFSCVLCSINFKYKIQFIEHIITVHNNLLLNQMFDFCIPCATLWLNWSDCYTEHCNDVTHKYLIKNKDFMIEDLPECIKKLLRQVDKTVDILFQETQILVNDNARKEIEQSLKNILNSSFPFIKLYLFGSKINELGSANNVIDIFLDCGSTYYSDHKKWLRNGNLEIIEEIIRKQRNEWEVKEGRGISRTAIKLLYKPAKVECDVFITNTLSIENFKLIRSFNDLYPPCNKLILFIEKWLSCFDLPSRHGLINYAIAWLVIFYLQLNSDLPSVATLIQKKNTYKLMCGSKIDVVQPKNSNKSVQSISLLLLGFFQFYANFDYQHYIICPLMGYAVAKKAFVNLDTLPKEMKTYINHIRESNNPEYLRIDSPLCIQDPLDLSRNLTRTVNSITLKYFKQYCQDSAYILRQSSVKETNNAN